MKVIKLRESDFLAIPGLRRFWHLNAHPCTHEAGRRYTLARIAGHQNEVPVLSFEGAFDVKCELVVNLNSILDVDQSMFQEMIGMPESVDELKSILINRYAKTRGWSSQNIDDQKITLSLLSKI